MDWATARVVRDGRPLVAIVLGAVGIGLAVLPQDLRTTAWVKVLGVPARSPSFLDLRAVTSGWDCLRRGLQFLPVNQCDAWGRAPELPRLWLVPGFLGLGESSTEFLGVLLAAAFVAAVLLWVGRTGLVETGVLLLILLSPAVMLGFERGNVDLVEFCLVAAGLACAGSGAALGRLGAVLGASLVTLAAALKYYPALALLTLVVRTRWASAALVVVGLYVVVDASDVSAIHQTISWPTVDAYGLIPLCSALSVPPAPEFLVLLTTLLVAGSVALALLPTVTKGCRVPSTVTSEIGYVAGSAIYIGTYVLTASYPYKLVFLILIVPQCYVWVRSGDARTLGWAVLSATLAMLWLPRFSTSPGKGAELMAATGVVLFALLGSTSGLLLLRRAKELATERFSFGLHRRDPEGERA